MRKNLILTSKLILLSMVFVSAQELYVSPELGNDDYSGSKESPFKSIEKAVLTANEMTGAGNIIIKLHPGLYSLKEKLSINPVRMFMDSTRYTIEALTMPDDADWTPEKMPKIQSISNNNSITQFAHATGILVASENVSIRGIKFLGNPNPMVTYYYPVSKENPSLSDLEVSQCLFIGDKESAPIQGGVWAHGPDNTVEYSVFYECRNAVLFFNNVHSFTIRNTIVYGSYESAFWFGSDDFEFIFENNIIAHNTNFLVGPKDLKYSSAFSNSLIVDNSGYVGYWSRDDQKVLPINKPNIVERRIIKSGQVRLKDNSIALDKMHLHLTKDSKGQELKAGIFKD
ncbi:right-handed parallel beta-helix repeat-containing protein [Leeuwenhoekiella sp. A16]|uniref:right-handed parallel beta-helix repeat-containing protein n=1 Tax=Leeuwenhoekiella sp. A16 TaxID=3141462 RepID=UPI003A80AB8F